MNTAKKRTLGTVATYINGRAFKPSEWKTSGKPIIRIQNLTDSTAKYNFSDVEHEEKFLVTRGDLLFAWSASLGAHIWSGQDAWLNQHIFKVIPNDDVAKKYLYYFLLHVVAELYSKTHGSGMVHITKGPFLATEIPVPSLPEQERIVAKIEELFSQLDAAIAELKSVKEKLAIYRQAVLKEAFENLPDCKQITLGDVIEEKPRNGFSPKGVNFVTKYRNLTLSATTGGFFREGFFKYVDIDINDDSYLWVKQYDILIQRANTIDYVGTAAIYEGPNDQYVYPDLMMKCHTKDGINPFFIVYQLHQSKTQRYYRSKATGTAGNMPKINQTTVMNTPMVFVKKVKQDKIVESIELKFSLCNNIEQTVDTALQQADALRQSILKQAFEGNL